MKSTDSSYLTRPANSDTNGAITLLYLAKSARSVTLAPNVLYGSTKRYHTDRSCSIKDANRK